MPAWLELSLLGWLMMAAVMLLLWLVALAIRNAAVVDVGWSLGLALLAWLYAVLGDAPDARRFLLAVMAGVHGLRLAAHLTRDRILGVPEEGRYVTLREHWGPRANLFFFVFFQAQALLDVMLAAPFLLVALNPTPELHPLEFVAAAVWFIGLVGEAIADLQLRAFKADPANRGKVCRAGLWRYSRHPNYFFEWLMWCAYGLLALAAPWGWIGLLCPLVILYLLFRVTGIPATEAQALRSRGDAYRDYQRTTSPFVPWFPAKETA